MTDREYPIDGLVLWNMPGIRGAYLCRIVKHSGTAKRPYVIEIVEHVHNKNTPRYGQRHMVSARRLQPAP
jgi:hypothetical protein